MKRPSPFGIIRILLTILLYLPVSVAISQNCTAWARSNPEQDSRPDATILLVEKNYQVDPDGNYTLTLHLKTKIHTYRGRKNWADFKISYNSQFEQVRIIEAKTIGRDGSTEKVTPKEIHDITDPSTQSASLFSSARLKVVNFPSVEEGCTVELLMEKKSRLGFWTLETFSGDNPILLKKVEVTMPSTMNLSVHLMTNEIESQKREKGNTKTITWTGKNRPKIISEPFMPPIQNRPDTLILSSLGTWQDVSKLFSSTLFRATPTDTQALLAALPQNIRQIDDPDELYIKLSKAIEIYPIGFFKSNLDIRPPITTLKSGYGSQMDAIVLFKNILKAKGMDSSVVAANSGGIFLKKLKDSHCPSLFNTFLLKCKDKFYSFDMKEAPPGITGMDGQMALDLESGRFITIRDTSPKETVQEYVVKMSSPASFVVDYVGEFKGTSGIFLKNSFKDLTPEEFKVRQSIFYHSLHPLAHPLEKLKVQGLSRQSTKVRTVARYNVQGFQVKNSNTFFFPLKIPGLLESLFALLPERKNDLFIKNPSIQKVSFSLTLPEGLELKGLPPANKGAVGPISWMSTCRSKSEDSKSVLCTNTVTVQRGLIDKGQEYSRLRKAVQRLMDIRTRTIKMMEIAPENPSLAQNSGGEQK
ncbi:MAG: DUF3857 domain-containing protein [Thermodesulfobacteria bacterium]|nr:DUF3857 domain-containing protein [Thermodesulfobacteriota bacterium]